MTSRTRILGLPTLLFPMTVLTTLFLMVAAGSASAVLPACNGGGRIVNYATMSLSNCAINGYSTGGAGGGVENYGTMDLTNVVISGNTSALGGGGLYSEGTVTLTNVVVMDNTAGEFGGGILNVGGTIFMSNVTVIRNTAGLGGGGIGNIFGSVIGAVLAVADNKTSAGDGGGILSVAGDFCINAGIDFTSCNVSPAGGNSLVSGNSADGGSGGGIANDSGTLTVSDSTVDGNHAAAADGGGVWNELGVTQLVNATISNNVATGNGGGIFNNGGTVCCPGTEIYNTNLTIAQNQAGGNGGGVYTASSLDPPGPGNAFTILGSSTIADNTAAGSGGGVYNDDSSGAFTELQNTLLARNGGTNCAGMITSDGSNLDTGTTCAFAGTGDQTSVGDANVGLFALGPYGGPTQGSAQFMILANVVPGLSAPMETMGLEHDSPAVDTGSGCPTIDERGVSRPQDGNVDSIAVCDIGAFELPPCLRVEKTCAVVPPPPAFTCKTPITALQLQWAPGSMTNASRWVLTQPGQVIDFKAWSGDVGSSTLVSTQCNVKPGDIVAVSGLGAKDKSFWQVYAHVGTCVPGNAATVTGTLLGQSSFKLGGRSCDDPEMNSANSCGKFEGDGKQGATGQTNLINDWTLQGLTGSSSTNATLTCYPAAGPAEQNCVVPIDGANVLYSYTITNVGTTNVTGTLIDKVGNAAVAGPVPFTINAGAQPQTFTSTQHITVNTTNVATVTKNDNATCTWSDSVTVNVQCTLYYPYNSSNPLTSTVFNESTVLKAFQPDFAGPGETIRAFYSDEHALLLGIRQVVVKTKNSPTVTTNFAIATPPTTTPLSATNPAIGSTALTGDNGAVDGSGRPFFPAVFITDLTLNGDAACSAPDQGTCGDWQYGGVPQYPNFVSGMWKGAVKTVDKTKTPTTVTITVDADPSKNSTLGPGADPVPSFAKEDYLTEVRWNVSDLKVDTSTGTGTNAPLGDTVVSLSSLVGHSFRVQFMVHDGDQNKSGGDVGQNCSAVTIPTP